MAQTHRPLRAGAGARRRRTRLPVERGRVAMIYIIAYDIADNKRRLRVAKTLEFWGYRIQESVFQLRLDTATLARALVYGCPHLRCRRRHPHRPHLLILRRPRRHTRRGHIVGRRGVVSGSVVRVSICDACERLGLGCWRQAVSGCS